MLRTRRRKKQKKKKKGGNKLVGSIQLVGIHKRIPLVQLLELLQVGFRVDVDSLAGGDIVP